MNICINIYGQQRDLNRTLKVVEQIKDNINNFIILYTGWEHETLKFNEYFPDAYIRRITKNDDLIKEYINKYSFIQIDCTNIHKSIEHIITGFYIKNESFKTIEDYLKINNNKKFDIIITIRTDTIIFDNKKVDFEFIKNNTLDKVYVCKEHNFDIYNQGACNDVFVLSNHNNMIKILDQLNYLDKVLLNDNVTFHPETSFYKYLTYCNFDICRLDLAVHV
jgi:hypothetical protein